jgi:hypothetical protein
MKSKGSLNESEAAELIADVENYRKENERLKDAAKKAVKVANEYELENEALQQQLKQAIEALETVNAQLEMCHYSTATEEAEKALRLIRQETGETRDT